MTTEEKRLAKWERELIAKLKSDGRMPLDKVVASLGISDAAAAQRLIHVPGVQIKDECVEFVGLLSDAERERVEYLESQIDSAIDQYQVAADAIMEVRESRLYREYGTFADYIDLRYSKSVKWAYGLLKAAEVNQVIAETDVTLTPTQARILAPLSDDQRREVVEKVKTTPPKELTEALTAAKKQIVGKDGDDEDKPTKKFNCRIDRRKPVETDDPATWLRGVADKLEKTPPKKTYRIEIQPM